MKMDKGGIGAIVKIILHLGRVRVVKKNTQLWQLSKIGIFRTQMPR